jgi:hypothetical protein
MASTGTTALSAVLICWQLLCTMHMVQYWSSLHACKAGSCACSHACALARLATAMGPLCSKKSVSDVFASCLFAPAVVSVCPQPQDSYGLEKLATEELCMHYNKDFGIECRIARFHNIYGPYGTWKGGREKAPAAFCRKVSAQQDCISPLGAGPLTQAQRSACICTAVGRIAGYAQTFPGCSVSHCVCCCCLLRVRLLPLFAGAEQQD